MSIIFLVPAKEELSEYSWMDCLQGLASILVLGQPIEGCSGFFHQV